MISKKILYPNELKEVENMFKEFTNNLKQLQSVSNALSKSKFVSMGCQANTVSLMRTLTFLENGNKFAVSNGGNISICDSQSLRELKRFKAHDRTIIGLITTKNGKLCSIAEKDNTLRFWNPQTCQCENVFESHQNLFTIIEAPGDVIISGGYGCIHCWDVKGGTKKSEIEVGKNWSPCNCIVMNFNNDEIACGVENFIQICVLDLKTNNFSPKQQLQGHSKKVTDLLFLKDTNFLCSSSEDNTIKMWFYKQEQCLRTLTGHTSQICGMMRWNDETLASASKDGSIIFWNINSGLCVKRIQPTQDEVYCVGVDKEGKLLSCDKNNNINFYF